MLQIKAIIGRKLLLHKVVKMKLTLYDQEYMTINKVGRNVG